MGGLYKLVYNKYYVDEIYDAAVVKPLVAGSRTVLWKAWSGLIDGMVNGVGTVARHWQRSANCCNRAISAAMRRGSYSAWCVLVLILRLMALSAGGLR